MDGLLWIGLRLLGRSGLCDAPNRRLTAFASPVLAMGASLTELSRYKDAETVLLKSYKDLEESSGGISFPIPTICS